MKSSSIRSLFFTFRLNTSKLPANIPPQTYHRARTQLFQSIYFVSGTKKGVSFNITISI